jgi:hypothetical protein
MPEHLDEVVPERPQLGRTQRRDRNFVDQMAQEGRLRQNFDVEELRRRLKLNGREFFEPMEPAG